MVKSQPIGGNMQEINDNTEIVEVKTSYFLCAMEEVFTEYGVPTSKVKLPDGRNIRHLETTDPAYIDMWEDERVLPMPIEEVRQRLSEVTHEQI